MTMHRVFKTRSFVSQMKKSGVSDTALAKAVSEMRRGLVDADLGGGVVKKRVAISGRGKSGGARTLVATNRGNRWFFIYGFLKNERANVNDEELEALKMYAPELLALPDTSLALAISAGKLTEIDNEQEDD